LHVIGLLSSVDTACLSAYCSSYAMWRRASEELESLTVETRAGDLRRHPLIKVIADAASDMVRYAGEFGLTPVARTRIAQGHQPPTSKFDGLLAGPEKVTP
jgi:P27 family predicted phage terminase small subunit